MLISQEFQNVSFGVIMMVRWQTLRWILISDNCLMKIYTLRNIDEKHLMKTNTLVHLMKKDALMFLIKDIHVDDYRLSKRHKKENDHNSIKVWFLSSC